MYDNTTCNTQCLNCTNDIEITEDEIRKTILSLDHNKVHSPDELPTIFYKNTLNNITKPLAILFGQSLTQMTYPNLWKISHLTPIYKSGDTSNIENYRPISVLSAISKNFDKILHNHIRSKTSHILSPHQHGFRAGKSTLTNLLEYVDFIANKIINSGQIDVVFMDLAKAFDTIDHNILLRKLNTLQLDPCLINLLRSYLIERKQFVVINGEKSDCMTPTSSVPQGSILSPLLFALFINDLPSLVKSKILLFADDLKIFLEIKSVNDARQLQNDINIIVDWCTLNGLRVNINKCNTMTFTRKQQNNIFTFNYNINDVALNKVNSCKDLGVTFDSKLSFDMHFRNITTRAYRTLGFISRSLNKFKDINTYKTLYNTYVRSIIDYCSPVWSPFYANHIKEIERIQKRFTRMLYRKFHFPTEPYETRLIRLELHSLENRRLLMDEMTLYKIFNGLLDTQLTTQMNTSQPIRYTRLQQTFYLPAVTTNIQYFSPILRMKRQHNETFNYVQLDEQNLNAFKRYIIHELNEIQQVIPYE